MCLPSRGIRQIIRGKGSETRVREGPSDTSNIGAVFSVSVWPPGNRPNFGLSFGRTNRRIYVNEEWPSISVALDGVFHEFEIDDQFWTTCPEIRGRAISLWLLEHDLVDWPKGHPPRLRMRCLGNRRFEVVNPSPKLYDPLDY